MVVIDLQRADRIHMLGTDRAAILLTGKQYLVLLGHYAVALPAQLVSAYRQSPDLLTLTAMPHSTRVAVAVPKASVPLAASDVAFPGDASPARTGVVRTVA